MDDGSARSNTPVRRAALPPTADAGPAPSAAAVLISQVPRTSTPKPILVSATSEESSDPKEARTLAQSPLSDHFPPTGTAPLPRPATAPLPHPPGTENAEKIPEKMLHNRANLDGSPLRPSKLSEKVIAVHGDSRSDSSEHRRLSQKRRNPFAVFFYSIFCCRSDATEAATATAPAMNAIPGLAQQRHSPIARPATANGLVSVHPSVQTIQQQHHRDASTRGSRKSSHANLHAGAAGIASPSAAGAAANAITQHIVLAPEREVQQQVQASQAAVAAAYAGGDELAQHEAARLTAGDIEPQYLLPRLSDELHGRKCLVLDLDETLVHSSFKLIPSPDFVVPVEIEGQVHNVYVLKRPGVDEFMRRVGEQFEVVIFTASLAKYADPVLDLLDKYQVIHHRLFRESCLNYKGNYVKDLSQLGRDIRHTLIIDNSPASYILHPTNAVPVTSWFSDPHDTELVDMIPFLSDLAVHVDDVTQVLDGAFEDDSVNDLTNALVPGSPDTAAFGAR